MQPRIAKLPSLRRRRWLLCPIAAACATLALAGAAPSSPPTATTYRVVPLAPNGSPAGINAKGQVAFTAGVDGVPRARFYDGSTIRDLGTFGGPDSYVEALNDLGQVVGLASTPVPDLYHAFRWTRQTGLVDLNPPGVGYSSAFDINNKGQVAGTARFPGATPPGGAFRWSPQTGMVNLGALGPTSSSTGLAINDAGTVVGDSDEPQGPRLTLVTKWPPGHGPVALNAFPSIASRALDINNAGQIVGSAAFDARINDQAFIWTRQGGLQGLGTEPSYQSWADRINEKGLAIGELYTTPVDGNGIIWSRETGLIVIGTPGVDGSDTRDVNNRGQVLGGLNGRSFVWTRAEGFVDLSSRVVGAPPGLTAFFGAAINDSGTIVAGTNTGSLVLLVPQGAHHPHQPPVAGPVTFTGPARANALLSFSAGFTDIDLRDSHKAAWSWGDGSSSVGIVSSTNGTGSVSGQHAWRKNGIYTVRLTITDSSGKSSTVERKVVICGAQGAISGEGTFAAAADGTGPGARKAVVGSFAFLSEGPGAGNAQVQVDVGGMALRSSQVDAVTVEGKRIRYSGQASVNGKGSYRFALTATRSAKAGGQDRMHVRITHSEPGTGAEVVDYDNGRVAGSAGAATGQAGPAAVGAEGGAVIEGRISLGAD